MSAEMATRSVRRYDGKELVGDLEMQLRSTRADAKQRSTERMLSKEKQLQRELAGLRSYRVGRLRVVYRQRGDDEIALVAVGPRRVIYEETYRRLQKESEQ